LFLTQRRAGDAGSGPIHHVSCQKKTSDSSAS
jgi:hypothetical protein